MRTRILLAGLLAAGLLLAACGKQPAGQVPAADNNQPDPPEAAAQPPTEQTGPVALRFGQSGIVGRARVTVQAPGWSTEDTPIGEDVQWAVFQVTWEALADRVTTPKFLVEMGGGEQFTREVSYDSGGQLLLTELDTGDRVSGIVSFAIPAERGKLIIPGESEGNRLEYAFAPSGRRPAKAKVGAKVHQPTAAAEAAERVALDQRMLEWNKLIEGMDQSQRIPLARWDNRLLIGYLNTWLHDYPTEEPAYPQPWHNSIPAAEGVLEAPGSPLAPTGTTVGDTSYLEDITGEGIYKGDTGDRTRYWWGFVERGKAQNAGVAGVVQREIVHLRIRFFRDSSGIDHALIKVLKTPPLG
jgi:hypothetical protein